MLNVMEAFEDSEPFQYRPVPLITQRDQEILESISTLGFATRRQLQLLHFPCAISSHYFHCNCYKRSRTAIHRRLRHLREARAIEQHPDLGVNQHGSIYTLRRCYELARIETQEEFLGDEIRSRKQKALKRRRSILHMLSRKDSPRSKLWHTLLVGDIYVWFRLSERATRDRYLPSLQSEYQLRAEFEGDLRPDSVVKLHFPRTGWTTLYIEADCATERLGVLQHKISAYDDILSAEQSLVLFIANTARHRSTIEKALSESSCPTRVWWTSINDLTTVSSNALLDPVWRQVGIQHSFGLRNRVEKAVGF